MSKIKYNSEQNTIELWIDGTFKAGWDAFDIPEGIEGRICNMIDYAVAVGERKKADEIRKVLGVCEIGRSF
jgi:hypothetical protein